ncbi:hypothetical protein AZA_74512 [Nitrospirillum viridazoti Y2]|uniref:Uncharacterized protein n=1 Tax=Nitrospirillum amazonense TaxID=28077 RepID=A0A560HWP8_9PROT|nr:hypothetical protein [Nitrospirillum amazonense]EGX99709.1 hypothetical protein AZA_74512 [Nitrospirillum amazonense Y2]TWB51063.1 hypothetical protein FBZ92_12115 [Nitrospirillum amazonense]
MPTRTRDLPRTRDVNAIDIRGRLLALSRSHALGRRVVHRSEDRDADRFPEDSEQDRDGPGPGDRP